jgi:small multidrug resistance pump
MQPLLPWMRYVLRFVAVYNVLAGLSMLVFYHEAYKMMGLETPDVKMPLQLVGILVGLFGVGYWLVASDPIENRNVLMLGFWSKLLGSCLSAYYVACGKLPAEFMIVVFFADIIYLAPFYLILKRLYRLASERSVGQLPGTSPTSRP